MPIRAAPAQVNRAAHLAGIERQPTRADFKIFNQVVNGLMESTDMSIAYWLNSCDL